MNKQRALIGALLVGGLFAGSALAGLKKGVASPYPVTILNGHAFGSLGSARNSSDSVQYVYMDIEGGPVGAAVTFFFKAADGTTHSCSSSSQSYPFLIQVATAMAGDSWVNVYWNSNNECYDIIIEHGSDSPPKQL
jgi:hypothetical protein